MCGRFNVIDDPLNQLLKEMTGKQDRWPLVTELNIAPTRDIPILLFDDLVSSWELRLMRWWLIPRWADGPTQRYKMFNARSESLRKSKAFKEPYEKKRCIIPASGYYEWRDEDGLKQPYYITPCDQFGFAFAGVWESWQGQGRIIESCAIVTKAAPLQMRQIHSRIPLSLSSKEILDWLSNSTSTRKLDSILQTDAKMNLRATPVSRLVNSSRIKDERCLEAVGEPIILQ